MNLSITFFRKSACLSGALAVVLGAFAAHSLKHVLSEYETSIWQTAVFYQFIHTLLLLFVSFNPQFSAAHLQKTCRNLCLMLVIGIILFSGSLYLIALTGVTKLGMITPIGGTLFIASWLYLLKLTSVNNTL